jgi:tetratricopeptide (TPR) repeat protein
VSPSTYLDPFAEPYYAEHLRAASELARAPARGRVAGVDVVQRIDSAHSVIHIGRGRDGGIVALKGFRAAAPDEPVTARWLEIRNSEALNMIRCGYGGLLPITEIHIGVPGGPIEYIVMPYCQGGSLRDRLATDGISVAALAYHGFVVASAMRRLHRRGLIHGDIKPENILFIHGADDLSGAELRWRTVLADLETIAKIGDRTSWRFTPRYASPEQIDGAAAAPAMDVWAWGKTMRDGFDIVEPLPNQWSWLVEMVDRAMSDDTSSRPTTDEIIDGYGRHIGFGNDQRQYCGASDAVACYPDTLMVEPLPSWEKADDVNFFTVNAGWAAFLPDCKRLYQLNTVAALLRIEELCCQVLGDPNDPDSAWQALSDKDATALPVGAEAAIRIGALGTDISSTVAALTRSIALQVASKVAALPVGAEAAIRTDADVSAIWSTVAVIPRAVALRFVTHLAAALVELVEATGESADLDRLRALAQTWESVDEFESEADTALLAQSWLSLDDPERALPYLRRSYAADPKDPRVLAARRLYYRVIGDDHSAAVVAMQPRHPDSGGHAVRWVGMAILDLLEAQAYDELEEILDGFPRRVLGVELVRAVAAGRRGPVQPDPHWRELWAYCTKVPELEIAQVRYLVEAAFQRGECDLAANRAEAARALPTLRMPIHHQPRAAIEAVALGRDPADKSLTVRLNNRVELWSRDGRLDDPLVGLDLVTAQRWVAGRERARLSADAFELVHFSVESAGEQYDALLLSTRRCIKCRTPRHVQDLSVCGSCHRLYCAQCSKAPLRDRRCVCGGDLVHPPALLTSSPRRPVEAQAGQLAVEQARLALLKFPDSELSTRMRAALQISCERLTPAQARILRLLALAPGTDAESAAVAALSGLPGHEADAILHALGSAHLISCDDRGRWTMHEAVRLYARELPEAEEYEHEQATGRLFEFYALTAWAAATHLGSGIKRPPSDPFADRDQALAWLDANRANLTGTVAMAAESSRPRYALILAVDALPTYFEVRRLFPESIAAYSTALATAQELQEQGYEARALHYLAGALRETRRFDEALDAGRQAADAFNTLGHRQGERTALGELTHTLEAAGRFEAAIETGQRALELFREDQDHAGEATLLNSLGLALCQAGRLDEALEAHQQAAEFFRQTGDRHRESAVLANLTLTLQKAGRLDKALEAGRQAVHIAGQLEQQQHHYAATLTNLGLALLEAGRLQEAIDAHLQATDLLQDIEDQYEEGRAQENLGDALAAAGRAGQAIDAYQRAGDLFGQTGDRYKQGMARDTLGGALTLAGRLKEAAAAHRQAAQCFQQSGDQHNEGVALNSLGNALQALQRYGPAADAHQQASDLLRNAGEHHGHAVAQMNLGCALAAQARWHEAIDAHNQAADVFAETGDWRRQGVTLMHLGSALRQIGRFPEAVAAHQLAAAVFEQAGDRDGEQLALDNLAVTRLAARAEHSDGSGT